MNPFESVDTRTLLPGDADAIPDGAHSALAQHPLDSVETEYPHWVGAVESAEETVSPTRDHPVFYGCFDWHSAVHSHWTLVRLLRLVPDHPDAAEIRRGLDDRLTDEAVAGELDYFDGNESFEQPYGWAWLLRLAAELHLFDDAAAETWRETLRPLETRLVELVEARVLPRERPIRVGTHGNSAFALAAVLDYATVVGNDDLAAATRRTARRLYLDDTDAPLAYEPLGYDFLSPALAEADLLRRVLRPEAFAEWFDGFLPGLATNGDALPEPVAVAPDESDGHALHLVGLNLSRAWCLAGVADTLDRDTEPLNASAARHLDAGLSRAFTDAYGGAHWLSSFVLYAITRAGGGIAP
ncbi:DUF2891 domain-containing protein [Halobacteriales archaeon SW_8_65_20]|nr:MAG: DUF2891 domain-containing protein [Halobacteriales archaeon SW_8_65_20]